MRRLLPARAAAAGAELVEIAAAPGVAARLRPALWQVARVPPLRGFDAVLAPSLSVPPPGRARLVVYVHDLAFLRLPDAFTRWGRWFHGRGLDLARRHAAVVLTNTCATAADLHAAGFGREQVRVAGLGVDPPALTATEAARRRDRLGVVGPYVLAVGTLEPRKNLATTAAAVDRLTTGHRLVVVGARGWGDVSPPPDALALGRVGDEDLAALYLGAAVLCYPSLDEGFGLPVAEAMAHGVPVVTADRPALREVGGDVALYADPHDPAAVASALDAVLTDPELAQRMRTAGRQRAAAFSWDRCADITWEALAG